MALFFVALLSTTLILTSASEGNVTVADQNLCVLKHMLAAYTGSDDLALSNMRGLFDAVTIGYHDQAPTHGKGELPDLHAEEGEAEDEHHHRKRAIHRSHGEEGAPGEVKSEDICEHDLEGSLHQCLPGSQILAMRGFTGPPHDYNTTTLSVDDFVSLCPALLYQLTMTPCLYHKHAFLNEKPLPISATNSKPMLGRVTAWVGALGAVFVISICGLIVISLIPLIKRAFYQQAIQFLVALAVGTLVGDALLHLLPHALSEHEEAETSLRSSHHHVWRASVSLVGIFIFFNAERILGVVTSIKRSKKALKSKSHTDDLDEDVRSEAGSCGSCAEVPYVTGHSSREITEMANEAHRELHAMNRTPCSQSTDMVSVADESNCQQCPPQSKSCQLGEINENSSSITHSSMPALNYSKNSGQRSMTPTSDQALAPSVTTPLIKDGDPQTPVKEKKVHEASDDGENEHGHGHSHDVPGSCSSVAYMVIMGDGLHNFTDGLAIGAAFSSSFTGGMSTSIAVLCHELPHELGDFAMLLKTGMSMKQAYLCNLVSASLQCLGAIIGVLIGNVGAASQWLFAFAGGIFLYVGLVDMLPEITKVDPNRVWKQLLLQNAGLLIGFTFMLFIAAFETDIENAFVIE